jgi:UDP-GlcNAc:undecaprenyl-phosphate GlcNAc-1-phosphate transferase
MVEISLTLFSLVIIYFINKYRKQIGRRTKLIDNPDRIRKFHKKPTPLLGGIMVFSSFALVNLYLILFQDLNSSTLIIFVSCTGCLVLGLIDDLRRISYRYKFFILIVIFLSTNLDANLQINKIYSSTFNEEFYLNHLSIPFTILCLLLLTNALNLIDGIDGLCILISIIFITWVMNAFQYSQPFYSVLVICLIYILYLNLKKNVFLGDSGSLFLGCLIGLNLILNYNLEISKINYPVENILIVLMIPGLDMLRVFLIRIFNNKNPFSPDRRHFHHLLLDRKIHLTKILIIFFFMVLAPITINKFFNIIQIKIILFFTFLYLLFVFFLKKKFFKN